MSKKVSESFVLFPRGQAAANVALGLVDLQHLFDLKVKAAVELRQAILQVTESYNMSISTGMTTKLASVDSAAPCAANSSSAP